MNTIDFSIRPWELSDLPALIKHGNNPRIAANMTDSFPSPFVEEKARMFLEAACSHEPRRLFAIVVNGEAAGGIGLHPQQDVQRFNAELGYWLSESHWGKGIMPAAVKQVVEKGFRDLNLMRIFAKPFGSVCSKKRALCWKR